MGLGGVMRASVSGMAAQTTRMGGIADNIANSDTVGYKKAVSEFYSMVVGEGGGEYNPGGLGARTMNYVGEQGNLKPTSNATDLAVNGEGFFVVRDTEGTPLMTRSGAFVMKEDGTLVNAAGYALQGVAISGSSLSPSLAANSFAGLQTVRIGNKQLLSSPSTAGRLSANLNSNATIIPAANLPSANAANAQFTSKTSLRLYDNLGNAREMDVYFAKSAEVAGPPPTSTWQVTVFDKSQATNNGFPYGAAGSAPLARIDLTFNNSTGALTPASATAAAGFSINVPNGRTMTLDLSQSSQLAADFSVRDVAVNGNPPVDVKGVEISADGTVFTIYKDGTRLPNWRIPLAKVSSPNFLQTKSGTAFQTTNESGDPMVGFAGSAGLGIVNSGSLESSTVDLASELTMMIEAQRTFTANTKSFQTGADMLSELVNLKR